MALWLRVGRRELTGIASDVLCFLKLPQVIASRLESTQ
jgi:hypothetical protein